MKKLKKLLGVTTATVLTVGAFAAVSAPAVAQVAVPTPSAHYDMTTNGTQLLDVSGNGRHAELVNVPAQAFTDYSTGTAMTLSEDGYARMPQGAVTADDNNFTVEMTVGDAAAQNHFAWVIGDGIGPWNTTQLGNYVFVNPRSGDWGGELLSGIRVKTDGGNGEIRVTRTGTMLPTEGFSTVTLTSSDGLIEVYLDGEKFTSASHSYSLADIIPTGETLGYIGRSLYSPDPLFDGTYLSLKIWDETLTPEQVAASVLPAAERDAIYNELFKPADFTDQIAAAILGDNPDAANVTTNLTPPQSIAGFDLQWNSSNPDVISETGTVVRPFDQDTDVTLTAVDSSGAEYSFVFTVLAASQQSRAQADADALSLSNVTYENLPLIATGEVFGSDITWTSSDPALVSPTDAAYVAPAVGAADPYQGGGLVDRPEYGTGDVAVTLTATITNGDEQVTRSFDVVIKEKGRTAPDAGYAAAYFKADNNERIYMDYTDGNDFFSFQPANDGQPVLVSTTDDMGLRDPYILRSVNGDKYYMVATDLCVSCGGYNWGLYQQHGSLKIHVWESTDLVNWERTTDHDGALTINQPAAGMTWAPEAYWDHDLQSYVVHFASRLYNDPAHTQTDGKARMFYVLTRDFKTFTYPPQEWQNTPGARIDSTVMEIDGMYYRFTKAESGDTYIPSKDIFLEKSAVLTSHTSNPDPNANPNETWQLLDSGMSKPTTGHDGEGPQVIKLNAGDPANVTGDDYLLLVDNYGAGGYRAFRMSGAEIAGSSWTDRLSLQDGWEPRNEGLPASPRHGAFVNVSAGILDAIANQTTIQPVASTVTPTEADRVVTFRVDASDNGQVVGTATVSFTPEGSSEPTLTETITLADQAGSFTVPGDEAGVVSISYDGYADGLVSPSTAAVEIAGVTPTDPTDPAPTTDPTDPAPTTDPTGPAPTTDPAPSGPSDPQPTEPTTEAPSGDVIDRADPPSNGKTEPLSNTGANVAVMSLAALLVLGSGIALAVRARRNSDNA